MYIYIYPIGIGITVILTNVIIRATTMARKSSNCHATHCRKLLERSGLNHVRSIPTLVNTPVNPIGYIYIMLHIVM